MEFKSPLKNFKQLFLLRHGVRDSITGIGQMLAKDGRDRLDISAKFINEKANTDFCPTVVASIERVAIETAIYVGDRIKGGWGRKVHTDRSLLMDDPQHFVKFINDQPSNGYSIFAVGHLELIERLPSYFGSEFYNRNYGQLPNISNGEGYFINLLTGDLEPILNFPRK